MYAGQQPLRHRRQPHCAEILARLEVRTSGLKATTGGPLTKLEDADNENKDGNEQR